jgi:hypothetical protein
MLRNVALIIFITFPKIGQTQTRFEIESIKTFARAYGYVKYFHPSDEAELLNWDKFAIYGVSKVKLCKSREELLKVMNELFLPIAPTIKFYFSELKVKYDSISIIPRNPLKFKNTYWQHLGVKLGMNSQPTIYQSVRVNRVVEDSESIGFGTLVTSIRAREYQGKEIKLTAMVKAIKKSKSGGQLWVRVDDDTRILSYKDMRNNPIRNNQWKKYEITSRIDSLGEQLMFGCLLKGQGEILVDSFQLFYKESGRWVEIPIVNSSFEKETIGIGKTWSGKSGGDYFIQAISNGCIDGNCVSICKSNKPILTQKIFSQEPKIDDVISENLGSQLSCYIPLTLYSNSKMTYPKGKSSELFKSIQKFQLKDTALELRIGNIINIWNVFQHFYPYLDEVNVDWERELVKALKKSYLDKDHEDFIVTLGHFTAPLRDGHISVIGNSEAYLKPKIAWEFIENKLIITKICQQGIAERIKVGDAVDKINGIEPKLYFDSIESLISSSTSGWMAYRANKLSLLGEYGSEMIIDVDTQKLVLTRRSNAYFDTCNNSITKTYEEYKIIDSGIYYLNLTIMDDKKLNKKIHELVNAKAIVCDLRGYPNISFDLLCHLINVVDNKKWILVPETIYPDHKGKLKYDSLGWGLYPKQPHINAKVIFIVDGSTISYAESFMGLVEGYNLGTIVGQPTAGTNGDINVFSLPGGYSITWTGLKVLKIDGSQFHGIGITPDILVSKSIKGVTEGRDEFLEKAIEIAKKTN